MPYCLLADILGVIPELELMQMTDDLVPPVQVNEAVVDQAISQATSLINGYIGGRYQLPLVTTPELVHTFAVDISVYKIYLRRKKKTLPDGIKTAYEDAMKQLRDVQSGRLALGVDQAGTAAAVTPSNGVEFVSGGTTFNRNSLGDY
jgi:phage gp36-like protein